MSDTLISTDAPVNGHTARRLETRRRLLASGTELFAERGVGDVTSTEIADRAGVATGTFYLHFDDKHALFEVLVQDALAEMRGQLDDDRLSPRPVNTLRAEMDRVVEVAERRRDLIRAVFDRGETTRLAERIQDRIADNLEPGYARLFAERGVPLHPAAAAQARAAMLVRVIAWWAEDPTRATRDQVVEVLVEFDPIRLPSDKEHSP